MLSPTTGNYTSLGLLAGALCSYLAALQIAAAGLVTLPCMRLRLSSVHRWGNNAAECMEFAFVQVCLHMCHTFVACLAPCITTHTSCCLVLFC